MPYSFWRLARAAQLALLLPPAHQAADPTSPACPAAVLKLFRLPRSTESRLVGVALDGLPSDGLAAAMAIELVVGSLAAAALLWSRGGHRRARAPEVAASENAFEFSARS